MTEYTGWNKYIQSKCTGYKIDRDFILYHAIMEDKARKMIEYTGWDNYMKEKTNVDYCPFCGKRLLRS